VSADKWRIHRLKIAQDGRFSASGCPSHEMPGCHRDADASSMQVTRIRHGIAMVTASNAASVAPTWPVPRWISVAARSAQGWFGSWRLPRRLPGCGARLCARIVSLRRGWVFDSARPSTRLRRCAQLIARRRSSGLRSFGLALLDSTSAAGRLPCPDGVGCARRAAFGANTPWVVPLRHGVLRA